ncbi:MAG: tRNA 2-selenouridine(34) synthase MnmH [Pseudomonadales bacterium]
MTGDPSSQGSKSKVTGLFPSEESLDDLLTTGTPFIDLRSPGEFANGAVPGAINLPLLTDAERHQVGLTYKHAGQRAAIATGHELVNGVSREARVAAWQRFARQHPDAWLYCWRGGLRSATAQQWLADSGTTLPRLTGGFKAIRRRCLEIIEQAPSEKPWLVLGGRTGTGKTELLNRIPASIDLEGLANHRGSAFGAQLTPQPPPIGFENALAVTYLRTHQRGDAAALLLEDESRTIGRLAIPQAWHEAMQQAPLAILDVDLGTRAQNISLEYVWRPLAAGVAASTLFENYRSALNRIGKRLGGTRKKTVAAEMSGGFNHGDHLPWIEHLLEWYYDPMYDYQLENKLDRVVFRGGSEAVLAFLVEFSASGRGHDRMAGPEIR